MNLSTLQLALGLLLALLAVTALAASVAAYFRASYVKATVVTLQENNAALVEQVRILKDANTEAERERVAEKAEWSVERERDRVRITALEQENDTLLRAVQGKAELDSLLRAINDHHTTMAGEVGKVTGGLDDLLTATGGVATDTRAIKAMLTRSTRQTTTSGGQS